MAAHPIEAVAFDVNETMFALDGLRAAFTNAGLDPHRMPLWFAGLLRDGFALTVLGEYRSFADAAVATVTGAMRQLRPHPDVEPALRSLREAGIPTVTLTNGSVEVVQALLEGSDLAQYVARNLSVDAVRRWKPAPEPYQYAATELAVSPGSLALVAAHPWDCAGATGLRPARCLGASLRPALARGVPRSRVLRRRPDHPGRCAARRRLDGVVTVPRK